MLEQYVSSAIQLRAASDEIIIRSLLGRWVSELEPAVAWCDGEIIGLCPAGAEIGTSPFILER
jgi:hypothetical protein